MAEEDTLLEILRADDDDRGMAAAVALSQHGTPHIVEPLIALMRTSNHLAQQVAATYALAFLSFDEQTAEEPVITALWETLCDATVPTSIRAQAAEGLANFHMSAHCGGRQPTPAIVDTLISVLDDPSAEVRFWSAFALGTMRCRQALPALQRLAQTDHALLAGWWLVSAEASDAIDHIEGRTPPERNRIATPNDGLAAYT